MPALQELRGQLDDRRKKLKQILDEAKNDGGFDLMKVTVLDGSDPKARTEQVQALDRELNDLVLQIDDHPETKLGPIQKRLDDLDRLNPHPGHVTPPGANGAPAAAAGGKANGQPAAKTLGQRFVELDAVKGHTAGKLGLFAALDAPDMIYAGGMKATWVTADTNLDQLMVQDIPGIQLIGQQRLTVADLMPNGQTTSQVIRYVVENTYTNAATVVAEGAAKPEATFDTDVKSDDVSKIAVLARVTDELFADLPMLRSYIDQRMRFMVGQTEEAELLSGDGTGQHIDGLLHRTGIQTQPKGVDPTPDAIFKAMVLIQTGPFADPDGVVMHPLDWQDIALLRTDEGLYVWGQPNQPAAAPRIWGLPIVVTSAITQNTSLVGAFRQAAMVWRRQGITVDATNSNEDDFKKNLIMLRAEERVGLSVFLPTAFCKVTGV